MKKIIVFLSLLFLMAGCTNNSKEDVINDFQKKIENIKSYKLNGSMEVMNDEESFVYTIESYYLKDDYYKVILVNQNNNHEQIILKTDGDVYVITPSLNKSFKFESEWPNNSSQAYLLGNILNDIKNDNDKKVEESNGDYIITSKVNYPNNEDLKYQKVYLDSNKLVTRVEVYDENDIVKIRVMFNDIDLKANLNKNDFNIEEYIKDEEPNNEESCENEECEEKTASIENIIYPLYIPSNTFLTNSETIETGTGNRVILTFSGEKNFVLIEEAAVTGANMEVVPVYGEPLMLSESIGALSANSLSWDSNNISYYLASTELSTAEMKTIAESLGNTTLVSTTK